MVPRKICDLSTSDVRSIIDHALRREDNFINAPRVLQAYTVASGSDNGIRRALRALAILRDQRSEFFREVPYLWAFDESAYRRPTDASLQTQSLQLLAAFRQRIADYPVERDGLGQVVCIMAIAPNTFGPGPRVLAADGESGGGIAVFPSGWFTALSVFVEIERCRSDGEAERSESLIKGLYARAAVEESFRRERDRNMELDIPVGLWDLIRDGMTQSLVEQHPMLTGALLDLKSLKHVPDRSLALEQAASSFAIAHEVSHILRGDHRRSATTADESLADNIAFDMLANGHEWKRLSYHMPLQDALARSALACSVFLYASMLHLDINAIITDCGQDLADTFRKRARSLQLAAQVQPIPTGQQQECSRHAGRLTEARQWAVRRVKELSEMHGDLRDELCHEAFETGIRRFVGNLDD